MTTRAGGPREPGSPPRRGGVVGASLLLLCLLPGCGADPDQTLTVFAAASLTAVLAELEEQYEDEHPGVDVRVSSAGSAELASQVQEGAEADVFASADTRTMATLVEAGLAGDPQEFATNTLTIAVPSGNPAGVRSPGDLGRAGLDLVVCAPEVPCGAAAEQLAENVGIELDPVSEEQSVTDVLAKVRGGEADAGLVYVTDVRAADGEVEEVTVDEAAAVVNHYPVAVVEDSDDADLAQDFVDLLVGDRGQAVLSAAGFGPPRP